MHVAWGRASKDGAGAAAASRTAATHLCAGNANFEPISAWRVRSRTLAVLKLCIFYSAMWSATVWAVERGTRFALAVEARPALDEGLDGTRDSV